VKLLMSALFGALFGVGLLVSGMTDPARVLAFLDVAGDWNPALAFVMGGAVAVALPAFALARRKSASALGGPIELPDRRRIDARLIAGAAIFGLGWGLSGVCPGPAIVLMGLDLPRVAVFVAALVIGGWLAGVRIPARVRPAA
jgi:uncharacterized membrane protein YedE/YeeE